MKVSITLLLILQTVLVFSQNKEISAGTNKNVADVQVVINKEMINRFNQVKVEDDIYSWRQLLSDFSSITLQEYFRIYYTSDLENQTLASLKLALEKALEENNSSINDDYINQIIQIKAEINQKLNSSNQMLVSK